VTGLQSLSLQIQSTKVVNVKALTETLCWKLQCSRNQKVASS